MARKPRSLKETPTPRGAAGFTLVELLVVVMIIAILAAVALPQYFRTVERSRLTEVTNFAAAYRHAQARYYLRMTVYANDMAELDIVEPPFDYFTWTAPTVGAGTAGTACSLPCGGVNDASNNIVFTRNDESNPPGIPDGYTLTFTMCTDGNDAFCLSANRYLRTWTE